MDNSSTMNTTAAYLDMVPSPGNSVWKTDQLYKNWLTIVLVTGCGFAINLYIIIAMIIHISTVKNIKSRLREKGSKRYRLLMDISLLITAVMLVLNTPAFEKIIVDLYVPSICSIMRRIRGTGGSYLFVFSYLVLWFRQRSIYSDPAMRHLTTRVTRTLSLVVLVLLLLSPMTTHIIYVSAYTFSVIDSGCAIVGSTVNPQAVWIIIGSTSLIMQSMLLWLFVLPLYKHSANAPQSGTLNNQAKIKAITQRAFVTGLICSATDTLSSSMAASSVLRDGITLPLSMYISLFVNLMMVVLSFPDWKQTMFPCCRYAWKKKPLDEECSQVRISSKASLDEECSQGRISSKETEA